MRTCVTTIVVSLLFVARPAAAQSGREFQASLRGGRAHSAVSIGPVSETSRLLRSRTLTPRALPNSSALAEPLRLAGPLQGNRARHALIGGVIGAAAGIVVCTAISNYVNEGGFSTCTTTGYVVHAAGGFALGALVGYLIK